MVLLCPRLDGETLGAVGARGIKLACRAESGGRDEAGRDDGGWFSTSDDCGEAGVDSLVGGAVLGRTTVAGDGRTGPRAERIGVGDGCAGDGSSDGGLGVD